MDHPDSYKLIKRCPVCLSRDMDVLLIPQGNGNHRCLKCSFTGSDSEIMAQYRDIQKKYHWMSRRVTLDEQRAM